MPISEDDTIKLLEQIASAARAGASVAALRRNRSLCSALKTMGFAAHLDFLRVITFRQSRNFSPSDLEALRAVSHDQELCRKLHGSALSEQLLYLLSHESIRNRASRRFLHEVNRLKDFESVWMAVYPLVAALDRRIVKVRRFASLRHYLAVAEAARQRINSDAYHFPPPPFSPPSGWKWLSSGADFKSLADYSPKDGEHQVEHHHHGVNRGETFLLRDPVGHGWALHRLNPSSNAQK